MMKRTILHIATAVMMLAIFTACESEDLRTTFGGGNARSIKLLLNAQGDEITRAVSRSDDNDDYGENTIATADVFFYKADGTLLYDVAKEKVTLSEPDTKGVVTATVPMPSPDENIDLTQAATVYVMGNRQAADADVYGAKDSEDALRALNFTTDLAAVPTDKTTFAMDGTGNININVTDNEISGSVELVRNAAKSTLTVNLPSTLIADGKTYQPQKGNITVTFNEGVEKFGDKTALFDVEKRPGTAGTADANDNTPVTFEPFYSYPTTWETGDDNEPYFTLHVPWEETNGGSVISYKTYHYRVPINKNHFEEDKKTLALNRNHWYQVSVNVGVLGTPEASDEVELTANYEVKPWGNLPIGANLLDFKYLVVDQERVEIYNQNSASVAFASSHPVTLEIISIKKWDYSTDDGRELTYAPSANATDKSVVAANTNQSGYNNFTRRLLTQCKVDAITGDNPNKGNIELKHDLINQDADTNDDVDGNGNKFDDHDYVSYTIVVKVSNGFYEEEITFIQYPEVYVTAYPNSDYDTGTSDNNYHGGVYVNGKQFDQNGNNYGGAYHLGSATNKNPNMYVITTTALSNESTYLIGDPRKTDIDLILNSGNNWSTTANALYDGNSNRQIRYYYPTDNSSVTKNVIAPKFRIASSYGVTESKNYDTMRRRCASYQEDGYPAGRWRMPTMAEMEYVVRLSAEKKIPQLFNWQGDTDGSEYWCAHGVAQPLTNGTIKLTETNDGSYSVRCVYDDWYWGSEPAVTSANRSPFTWGDQPR